ncbi:hypothetical protein HG531_010880 [Fusarium graminearum]|nr:hypothetical protein HG531_010880 [Fusarium graminearum]
MTRDNLEIVLAERPTTDIIPGRTFTQKTGKAPTPADLQDGQILVETLYLSLDPAMRGWLRDMRSYLPPVQIGETMRGSCACRVIASKSKLAKEGDIVAATPGWTEFAIVPEGRFEPASYYPGVQDPKDMLSALGMTSLTAWVGMAKIADPQPGELVVVSGAAGATGSVAGQIAKLKGATVVGIAGGEDKCKWLTEELGFDVALNYKADDFKEKFNEATKNYIDVYYDNVGGDILDMCLMRAKEHARFIECGLVSQYNAAKPQGPRAFSQIVTMRIKMQGFIVLDHAKDFATARADLAKWMSEGKLKKTETVIRGGLKVAEQALVDLYKGINTGKLIVEIKNHNDTPSKLVLLIRQVLESQLGSLALIFQAKRISPPVLITKYKLIKSDCASKIYAEDSPDDQAQPQSRIMILLGLAPNKLRTDNIPDTVRYKDGSRHETLFGMASYVGHANRDDETHRAAKESRDGISHHRRSSPIRPLALPNDGAACNYSLTMPQALHSRKFLLRLPGDNAHETSGDDALDEAEEEALNVEALVGCHCSCEHAYGGPDDYHAAENTAYVEALESECHGI